MLIDFHFCLSLQSNVFRLSIFTRHFTLWGVTIGVSGAKKVEKVSTPSTGRQYERLCAIIRRIQGGKQVNNRILAEEHDVRSRTIQRDMDFLRNRWQLPLKYDANKYTWYFTEPVTHFPLLPISEGELVSVFIAQKALAQYHGTPFEQPLRAAFDKLAGSLKGEISVSWADLDSAISFRSIDTKPTDLELFQKVSLAVRKQYEVRFKYLKPSAKRFETRQVRPYHLACISNQWYLFAFDPLRQDTRTFALSRMKEIELLSEKFLKPRDFSIDEYLKGSFGVFAGKSSVEAKIWFDSWAARYIRERTWHRSQRIRRLSKGQLELQLTLSSNVEIIPWLLNWGIHARALSPKSLIDEVKAIISHMSRLYGLKRIPIKPS